MTDTNNLQTGTCFKVQGQQNIVNTIQTVASTFTKSLCMYSQVNKGVNLQKLKALKHQIETNKLQLLEVVTLEQTHIYTNKTIKIVCM